MFSIIKIDEKTSKKTRIIHAESLKDAIIGLFKCFATQEKLGKRIFGLNKTNKMFLYFNGQSIHSVAFTIAKHTPLSAAECILNSLLPEFQSLRPELEQLISVK
jgi:hypothetical protein